MGYVAVFRLVFVIFAVCCFCNNLILRRNLRVGLVGYVPTTFLPGSILSSSLFETSCGTDVSIICF